MAVNKRRPGQPAPGSTCTHPTCCCCPSLIDLRCVPLIHLTKPQHPPIEGNAFLSGLFEARPVYSIDPVSGSKRHINPAAIANAVLTTRESLATQLSKTLPGKVSESNMSIMREHLETHTYVSGTNIELRPTFRSRRTHSTDEERHQLQQ